MPDKVPDNEGEQKIREKLAAMQSEEIEISPRLQAMIDKANRDYADGLTEELDPDTL
jgi:hypothetical protein